MPEAQALHAYLRTASDPEAVYGGASSAADVEVMLGLYRSAPAGQDDYQVAVGANLVTVSSWHYVADIPDLRGWLYERLGLPTPEVTDAVGSVPSPAPKESGGVGATPSAEAVEEFLLAPKAERHPLEARRDALVLRLLAAGFVEVASGDSSVRRFDHKWSVCTVPTAAFPAEYVERAFQSVEEALRRFEAAKQAPHDAARDWASLSGRWGQQHSAPLPEGLAGLGARGQEPIAPGPTLAEVQAENQQLRTLHSEAVAAREEAKRQRDEALAAAERERVQANEWLSQLHGARGHKEAVRHSLFGALGMEPDDDHSTLWLLSTIRGQLVALKESNTGIAQELADVDWTLNALGASGTGPAKERLLQVLPRHRVADLRTVELAEAKASIARIRCRNPGIDSSEEPLKSAYAREAAADVALHEILDQMEAAKGRDHVPDAGKKVNG